MPCGEARVLTWRVVVLPILDYGLNMIVIFGASTDIGRLLSERLRAAGLPIRGISRRGGTAANLSNGEGVRDAMADANVVVSCAHARYTASIIQNLPSGPVRLVLMGSAWRYSAVPNKRADEVRTAEAEFMACNYDGVMLHATMIYGGNQENNIQRLLKLIRRFPVLPVPGGGHQTVQPIYIDDVVDGLFAAVRTNWVGRHVVGLAGKPLSWRAMAQLCAKAIGRSCIIIPVPKMLSLAGILLHNRVRAAQIDAGIIERFGENVDIPLLPMAEVLAVKPREFEVGIRLAVDNWRRQGVM
jgi:nucleoside-diphosphate-sugar epimerase